MALLMRFLNHLAAFSTMSCCVYYYQYRLFEDPQHAVRPDSVLKMLRAKMNANGGRWRAFCSLTLLIQMVYSIVALLNDLLAAVLATDSDFSAFTQDFTDLLLCSLSLPVALFTGSLFWSVYLINMELMAPRVQFQLLPAGLNHGIHTVPVIVTLLDLVSMKRPFPSRAITYPPLIAFIVAYFVWMMLYLGWWRGYWTYPALKNVGWPCRCALYTVTAFILISFSELTRTINGYLISSI